MGKGEGVECDGEQTDGMGVDDVADGLELSEEADEDDEGKERGRHFEKKPEIAEDDNISVVEMDRESGPRVEIGEQSMAQEVNFKH